MLKGTGPYMRHSLGHALALSFHRPVSIFIRSPDLKPGSLFLKWIGLASPGLGAQYSLHLWQSQSPWWPGSSILSIPSEFEGQSNNSRMESDDGLQAFQVLIACMGIVLCLCLFVLFCWLVLLIQCNLKNHSSLPSVEGFRIENGQSHGGEPVGSAGQNLGAGKEV